MIKLRVTTMSSLRVQRSNPVTMKDFNIHQLLLIIALLSSSTYSCFATEYNDEFDDWIVSSTCKDRTSQLCHGYYLEPVYPYPLGDKTKYPTKITSDRGEFVNKGTSTFYGSVDIQQGNEQLKTDKATITHNKTSGELETMQAEGNVKITEPNLRVDGTRAIVYEQENRKIIYDSIYRMYPKHAHGTSDLITIEKQTQMVLPNASYTTCAPNSNTWFLRAKKTKFNKVTGRGEAWHSWLYIKNFKVFYWPYINFPIDSRRQTGFLMPGFHNSSSDGASLSAPFYWNLAPNYDAIITPQFMTKRGAKLDSNLRYLTEHSNGSIKFNFLPNDKGYKNFRNKRLANPNGTNPQDPKYIGLRDIHHRYSFAINDKTAFNKQFKSEIDYTRIGDDNYVFDFDGDIMQQNFPLQSIGLTQPGTTYLSPFGTTTPNYSATTAVRQKIELQYLSALGTLTSKLEQYQILHPFDGPNAYETYRSLPTLDFKSNIFDLPNDFDWRFSGNYTDFKIRELANAPLYTNTTLSPGTLSPGERLHFQPALRHSFGDPSSGWLIQPNVQLDTTSYRNMKLSQTDLSNNKLTRATRNIPIYNIDSRLIFERPVNITNQTFTQTLEPRAYYLYVPKRNQNLLPVFDSAPIPMDYYQVFRNNRYSGFDRVAEANQLGLGIKSSFLTTNTGDEKASVGIGRILYFQDRIPRLSEYVNNKTRWSPVAAIAKYQIRPDWNLEGNLVKENWKKTNTGALTLQYLPDPTHVVNFGYQFVRNDILDPNTHKPQHLKAVQTSSAWELTPQVRLLGRIAYDLNLNRTAQVLFGIEKHDCCTIFRLVWMHQLRPASNLTLRQYENAISFQFVLKGLTQAGNIDTNQITSNIPGYITKDNEF